MNEIPIQPSQYYVPAPNVGQQYGGIPVPGVLGNSGRDIPPITGVATCANLVADSPPTLFEQYEIYSFSIPVVVNVSPTGTVPNVELVLELLLNDRIASAYRAALVPTILETAENEAVAQYAFVSDLTNPILIGGRDRLGLRIKAILDQATTGMALVVAAAFNATAPGVYYGSEAKLFYQTTALPGRRRL